MATAVTGVVLHETEWTPLPNLTVYAYSTRGYTEGSDTTDSNGRFLITGLTNRDWMVKLAPGQSGRVLLVPTDVTPPTHQVTTGQTKDDHHPQAHLGAHHTGGDDALSLELIAGTVLGAGHGDMTGEALAIHAPTDLVGDNWKVLYSDGSGDIQELALGAAGTILAGRGAAAAPAFDTMSGDASIAAGGAVTVVSANGAFAVGGDIDMNGNNIDDGGVIFLREQAAADADVAGSGQIWVKNETPNELWFTDDAGTDHPLTTPTRTIVLTAGAGLPTTTSPCAAAVQVEAGTNDVDYVVLDFDEDADEYVFWGPIVMPDNWDGGTMTATFHWTTAGTSGVVYWCIQLLALDNDDPIDSAWGGVVTATDTFIAAGDLHKVTSGNITPGSPGTAAGGDLLFARVYRDADHGSDTLDADARLICIKLEYTTNAASD